jgi:hypothetical protein
MTSTTVVPSIAAFSARQADRFGCAVAGVIACEKVAAGREIVLYRGAARSTKMGDIRSLWRYDVKADRTLP